MLHIGQDHDITCEKDPDIPSSTTCSTACRALWEGREEGGRGRRGEGGEEVNLYPQCDHYCV